MLEVTLLKIFNYLLSNQIPLSNNSRYRRNFMKESLKFQNLKFDMNKKAILDRTLTKVKLQKISKLSFLNQRGYIEIAISDLKILKKS